jgi:AcrR family transcriptional regulator
MARQARTKRPGETAAAKSVRKPGPRQEQSAARREAILAAALDEFSTRGFTATRLDDVAKRAGVAKGTIYLHFADKEALFQDIVRTMVVPVISNVEKMPPVDLPIRVFFEGMINMFVHEIYGTRRREVIRLVIAEVPRFPALAEFYYREVIERALTAVRARIARAAERGELPNDALVQFPQLLVAPFLLSVIWNGLFERFAPLDVAAMLRMHLDLILGKGAVS